MYPENPEGTQVTQSSKNMGYSNGFPTNLGWVIIGEFNNFNAANINPAVDIVSVSVEFNAP